MTACCRVCLLASLLCLHGALVTACEKAAGVVAYAEVNEEIHILVADHKINAARGCGAFGGCIDADETTMEGALRELHEETRCALPESLAIDRNTPNVSFGRFTSYAMKIPFINAEDIASAPPHPRCAGLSGRERGPWAWIALDDLLDALGADDNVNSPFPASFLPAAEHRWFWSKSMRVIRALNEKNRFR